MASRYRFISCHATRRSQIDSNLNFLNPAWNWAVDGNGSLTARIAIPEDPVTIERVKAATEPLVAAIYVKDRNGRYPWGGPVLKRTWLPGRSQIAISCMEWRSWAHNIMYQPGALEDHLFTAVPPSGQEQLDIARSLFFLGSNGPTGGFGCPPYTEDSNTSGKLRELSFYTTQAKRIGELLDTMGNRDSGFEWTLEPRPDPVDGLPRLHLLLSYPERGGLIGNLKFKSTSGGSNFIPQAVEHDASSSYNQFLATGSGTPPDMLFASSNDTEAISNNSMLRMDGSASYNTVVDRNTLASHARRAILFFRSGIQSVKGTHTFGEIDPDSYAIGDRAQLIIKDRWQEVDLPAVRIIEKSVDLSGAGIVSVTLDTSDSTLPEVDAGGAI